jgi:hypothetical protein
MSHSELQHLELLASIDDLRERVRGWSERPVRWEPAGRCQALLKRVLERVETLRFRLEAPLIVATFGGTGTGKSSLVNALVGEEVTRTGRERPTTRRPVVIAHPAADLELLGLPLEELDVVRRDADLLRDVILLDCPDPDTTSKASDADSETNLGRLRALLPCCDVLLYVSTQQKYRSARVSDELLAAAAGCRILFVQTHAGLDEDVRDDWQRTLGEQFEVPEIFFVDSLRAIEEQQAGLRPSGDMGRLLEMLRSRFGVSERVRIRRANVLDLLQAGLLRCREILEERRLAIDRLRQALAAQQEELSRRMAERLQEELLSSHGLWERRLLTAVTDRWGMSPFSALLRIYNGLGGIVSSLTLMRARSTAQLALLGTIQGVRWWEGKRKEQQAASTLQRVGRLGLDEARLREAELVIAGHLSAAGLDPELLDRQSLEHLREQAAALEGQFVEDAAQGVDEIIDELSRKNSRWWVRGFYELAFGAYLGFILYRVGRNFFYESFWLEAPLLTSDFYLAAILFLILWSGVLVIAFTRRLRRGLRFRVNRLAQRMVDRKLSRGLFPQLERAVGEAEQSCDELSRLLNRTVTLRDELAMSANLGTRRPDRPTHPGHNPKRPHTHSRRQQE